MPADRAAAVRFKARTLSRVRTRSTGLLLILMAALPAGWQPVFAESSNVRLEARNGPAYILSVPPGYLYGKAKGESIAIRTVFPSMEWLTPHNRDKFFETNGSMTDDVIRIFLRLNYSDVNESQPFSNRNDRGRFILENVLRDSRYSKRTLSSSNDGSHHVELYSKPLANRVEERYVIRTGRRVTVFTCFGDLYCKAQSTLGGKIGVVFTFDPGFVDIADILESQVIALLGNFRARAAP